MGQMTKALLDEIHVTNPYEGFEYHNYPLDATGGMNPERGSNTMKQLIDVVNPRLILEVGTWKGASAIYMASVLRNKGMDSTVVCIDTWLGGLQHIRRNDPNDNSPDKAIWGLSSYYKNGYPTLYYQFLANVMYYGLQHYIVPFANTSSIAARWLLEHKKQANLIYIDGSHDEDDVYLDLVNYWKLLRIGGVMFGDDWHAGWPGVICAVRRFAREKQLSLKIIGNNWVIKKEPNQDQQYILAISQKLEKLLSKLNSGVLSRL